MRAGGWARHPVLAWPTRRAFEAAVSSSTSMNGASLREGRWCVDSGGGAACPGSGSARARVVSSPAGEEVGDT